MLVTGTFHTRNMVWSLDSGSPFGREMWGGVPPSGTSVTFQGFDEYIHTGHQEKVSDLWKCDTCGKVHKLSEHLECQGCGAPVTEKSRFVLE